MRALRSSGWFHDSYQHKLAAHGVKTRGYFAKGNREPAAYKRAYALGIKKSEFPQYFGVEAPYADDINRPNVAQLTAEIQGVAVQTPLPKTFVRPQQVPATIAATESALVAVEPVQEIVPRRTYTDAALEQAEESALAEYDQQKIAELMGGNKIITPGVPSLTSTLLEDSSGGA